MNTPKRRPFGAATVIYVKPDEYDAAFGSIAERLAQLRAAGVLPPVEDGKPGDRAKAGTKNTEFRDIRDSMN